MKVEMQVIVQQMVDVNKKIRVTARKELMRVRAEFDFISGMPNGLFADGWRKGA